MLGHPYWDAISHSYDSAYQQTWSRNEDNEIAELLCTARTEKRLLRVLDVGCGTGLGFQLLSSCFPKMDYIGIDTSQKMLSHARRRIANMAIPSASATLICAPALDAIRGMDTDTFDMIISLNATASYIARTRPLMRFLFRIVKSEGIIFLSFLNRYSLRRLIYHRAAKIKELGGSRGDFQTALNVKSITVTKSELVQRVNAFEPAQLSIHYQSVLGGVWETDNSIFVEKLLKKGVPFFGHTINVLAKRR